MFKLVITAVVLIIAAGAVWYTGWLSKWVPSIPTYSQLMNPQTATTTQETATNTQPQQQQAVNDLPTAANDASDEALVKDSASIDAQMSALQTDSSDAQSSTNDKPVTQEY
jgi:hypothetical protein